MLDIKRIKEQPEQVVELLARKGKDAKADIARILALDEQRRALRRFFCGGGFSFAAQVNAAQDLIARRRDARKLYAHDPGGKRRKVRRHFAAHSRQIRLRIMQQRCMRQPRFV